MNDGFLDEALAAFDVVLHVKNGDIFVGRCYVDPVLSGKGEEAVDGHAHLLFRQLRCGA